MANLKYTKEHEWIFVEGDLGTVGISDYAQGQLGDVVFVELPGVGEKYRKGDEVAIVESAKAASEVYAPVGGEVTGVNNILEEDPSIINSGAEGEGWFYTIKLDTLSDLDELMDTAAYNAFIKQLD